MIHLRERRVHDLRCHEVRKHFLHPHIVEPSHRHEIAEPHVRCFVCDDAGAFEQLVLRRRLVEHQAGGVVENSPGMLHSSELKGRDQDEVELAPRIRDRCIRLEPRQRSGVEIKQRVSVARDLCRVGLAVEHAKHATVARRGFDGELPRRKGEQIGRQRRCLLELDVTPPAGRSVRPLQSSGPRPFATACQPSGTESVSR